MQVKMRMRVNKTRKYQLSGGIYKLAAFRRINRRSNPADFFPVNQKTAFRLSFGYTRIPFLISFIRTTSREVFFCTTLTCGAGADAVSAYFCVQFST
jgi:hypothetical protein